jgi:hypothetical protein
MNPNVHAAAGDTSFNSYESALRAQKNLKY